jgi:ABC-type multidrug transport system ATPase subunit
MAAFLSFNKIGKKVNNINLLADLSFGVQKGELLFILGKTNSGKSTLFKILMGFIEKDRGQIFFDGMDYDIRKNEILPKIGYVPQKDIFDENLNLYENLFFHAELCGLNNIKIKEKILYWADRLNFKKNLKDSISLTSNSTLKKVAFSKALIHNPDILLIDDFTSSMDYYDKNIVFEVIQEIRTNKSILFISQDFNLADIYSDRIILINNGNISFNGSIHNLAKEINDIYKYRFTFKRIVPNDFLKTLRENKNIDKIISKDNNVQIMVKDKNTFFGIFKIAINYELIDIKMSHSKLTELFERIIES